MQFIRHIPVRPYALKYIARSYEIDPFVINKTNKYGLFLLHSLSDPKLKAVRPESNVKIKMINDFRELMPDELVNYNDQAIIDGLATDTILNYIASFKYHDKGLADAILDEFNKLGIKKKDPMDLNIFCARLPVMISENYYRKRGSYISPEREYDFNKLILYDFHEEFYKYVNNRIEPKGSINKAILNFRDQFGISEDELSFKTIQRAFQRHNENVKRSLSA